MWLEMSHWMGTSSAANPPTHPGSPPDSGYTTNLFDEFLAITYCPSGEMIASEVPGGVMGRVPPDCASRRYARGGPSCSAPVNKIFDPSVVQLQTSFRTCNGLTSMDRAWPVPVGYRTSLLGCEAITDKIDFPSSEMPPRTPSPRRNATASP